MFGFHAISALPFSASLEGVTHSGATTLNATGSVSSVGRLVLGPSSSMSATGSTIQAGVVHIAAASLITEAGSVAPYASRITTGKANIITAGGFSSGFTQGFETASLLSANGTIDKMHFVTSSSMSARPGLQISSALSLPFPATFSAAGIVNRLGRSSLNLAASLDANSVLLIGGLVELPSNFNLQGLLTSADERQDIVQFTLYVDKSRDITSYLSKTLSVNGFIDKNSLISSYLDKQSSLTGYIDKKLERDLVREK